MTQTGVVKKILDKGMADVAVERVTACSHCSGCGECIYGKEIHVEAENRIFAQPGERVVLESKTTTILGVTLLVYMLPVVMLFVGYAIGAALHLDQQQCIIASAIAIAIGVIASTELGKRYKKIDYYITGYKR